MDARRRRAQSLPLDVERRFGATQQLEFLRPQSSRMSLFPPLDMREVKRNYCAPPSLKVKQVPQKLKPSPWNSKPHTPNLKC